MSNQAFIVRTRFQDLAADGSVAETSYGLRVFDDHDSTYENVSFGSQEELLAVSKADLIAKARGIDDVAAGIIDFASESAEGLNIDGDWITWDEIRTSVPKA